ncbi:MAG: hypothetical protein JSS65_05575 [Armatimonadetes bacterium]|nr:hypothetical protein [Armatimonadota bacterium]
MTPETRVKIGSAMCVVGLAVAMLSLMPGVTPAGEFPLLIFVGSFIYGPGAFLAFLSAQGKGRNQVFTSLRFIRLGFFAVIAITIFKIMKP